MTQDLDVLILCQSLTVEECNGVLGTVREVAPTLRTIILGHEGSVQPNKEREQTLEPLQGPGNLLAAVHKMVGQRMDNVAMLRTQKTRLIGRVALDY
jgi:hypothetical protein